MIPLTTKRDIPYPELPVQTSPTNWSRNELLIVFFEYTTPRMTDPIKLLELVHSTDTYFQQLVLISMARTYFREAYEDICQADNITAEHNKHHQYQLQSTAKWIFRGSTEQLSQQYMCDEGDQITLGGQLLLRIPQNTAWRKTWLTKQHEYTDVDTALTIDQLANCIPIYPSDHRTIYKSAAEPPNTSQQDLRQHRYITDLDITDLRSGKLIYDVYTSRQEVDAGVKHRLLFYTIARLISSPYRQKVY